MSREAGTHVSHKTTSSQKKRSSSNRRLLCFTVKGAEWWFHVKTLNHEPGAQGTDVSRENANTSREPKLGF